MARKKARIGEEEVWVTPEQVMSRFQISRKTLLKLVRQGELHPVAFGMRSIRFDPEELERFIRGKQYVSVQYKSTELSQPGRVLESARDIIESTKDAVLKKVTRGKKAEGKKRIKQEAKT